MVAASASEWRLSKTFNVHSLALAATRKTRASSPAAHVFSTFEVWIFDFSLSGSLHDSSSDVDRALRDAGSETCIRQPAIRSRRKLLRWDRQLGIFAQRLGLPALGAETLW